VRRNGKTTTLSICDLREGRNALGLARGALDGNSILVSKLILGDGTYLLACSTPMPGGVVPSDPASTAEFERIQREFWDSFRKVWAKGLINITPVDSLSPACGE
jgi:hypothetical protein